MLASGTDINDFALPKDQRTFQLTDEATLAEHLVNLFTIEFNQVRLENFNSTLEEIYRQDVKNEKPPGLSDKIINEIRKDLEELVGRWNDIEEGKSLTFIFEE